MHRLRRVPNMPDCGSVFLNSAWICLINIHQYVLTWLNIIECPWKCLKMLAGLSICHNIVILISFIQLWMCSIRTSRCSATGFEKGFFNWNDFDWLTKGIWQHWSPNLDKENEISRFFLKNVIAWFELYFSKQKFKYQH